MKKTILPVLAFAGLLVAGCEKLIKSVTDVGFMNNTDYMITIYSILIPPHYYHAPLVYPDTTLPITMPSQKADINPHQLCIYSQTAETMTERYYDYNTDTISIFVFSTDTLNKYGWDSVQGQYNILQRYDISLNEYLSLFPCSSWQFPSFPPTEKMRNIKMWPPYGTYDSLGHRRE